MRPDRRLAPLLGAALAVLTTACLVAVSLIGVSGADNSGDRLEAISVESGSEGAMILPEGAAQAPAGDQDEAPTADTTDVATAPIGDSVTEVAPVSAENLFAGALGPVESRTLVGTLDLQASANDVDARGSRTGPSARRTSGGSGSDDGGKGILPKGSSAAGDAAQGDDDSKDKGKGHSSGKGQSKNGSHGRNGKGKRHGHGTRKHNSGSKGSHHSSGNSGSSSSSPLPGNSGGSPGNSGNSSSPGNSGSAQGHSGGSPGNSGKAKGHKKK